MGRSQPGGVIGSASASFTDSGYSPQASFPNRASKSLRCWAEPERNTSPNGQVT